MNERREVASPARRLGRPPAGTSALTRERILRAARDLFADLGYAATTNRHLAERTDVTTGALYHYFDSKLDLYRAVHEVTQDTVYARFEVAASSAGSFVQGFERVLDVAYELNVTEPSLARFLGAARVDVARSPELRRVLQQATDRRVRFVLGLVELGVSTGEVDVADRRRVVAFVQAMLIGLVHMSDDRTSHRAAIDALKQLIAGSLVHPPGGTRHSARQVRKLID